MLEGPAGRPFELKMVTTLFVDLVGFTALGERHDPEDVDASLRSFFALARDVIQRYGGMVEKYVGDAVAGVFGLPLAREDDAQKAVRAALEIVAGVRDIRPPGGAVLEARAGVNTGSVLVRLHRLAETGDGALVGDAVNTAARLQALAPAGGVVAGETTHALTVQHISYEPMGPMTVKGKSRPVTPWLATGTVARTGLEPAGTESTPYTGRELELGLLTSMFDKTLASGLPHHVLLLGEPGIGKSRLVRELARSLHSRGGPMICWRQGHCPGYGDGNAFAALTEIVRAHTGVLETDDANTAEEKLVAAVSRQADSGRLLTHLRPLLGLPSTETTRGENFGAWSRFLHGLAEGGPAVVVFEDLHWASDATLAFLRFVLTGPRQAPLLLVATARLDVIDASPSLVSLFPDALPAAGRNLRLRLEPLAEEECVRLVRRAARSPQSAAAASSIAARSGGNPLFAEELVRFLDAGPPARAPRGEEEAMSASLPDTIQSLIAARLDALAPGARKTITNAAVFGDQFWEGGVASLVGDGPDTVGGALRELTTRGLVRPLSVSSLSGEREYRFCHALIREAAYVMLPRKSRATRHRAVALWLDTISGGANRELSVAAARHYQTALQLAGAMHDDGLRDELRAPCARALAVSARLTLPLDVAVAQRSFAEAASLLPDDAPERFALLADWAEALTQTGELTRARALLSEAVQGLRACGDRPRAITSLIRLARVLYLLGDRRYPQVTREALELAEAGPHGPEWLLARSHWCFVAAASYVGEPAITAADEAMRACEEMGERRSPLLLGHRGMARCDVGDRGGLDDMRTALREARRRGFGYDSGLISYDLADATHFYRGPKAAISIVRSAILLAERRRDETSMAFLRAALLLFRSYAGRWDSVLAEADGLGAELRRHGQAGDLAQVVVLAAYLRSLRGELVDPHRVMLQCDQSPAGDDERITSDVYLAAVQSLAGHRAASQALLTGAADTRDGLGCALQVGMTMSVAADTAWRIGDVETAARFVRGLPELRTIDRNILLTHEARVLEAEGDAVKAAASHGAAAAAWHSFGTPLEEAQALWAQGRCLLAMDEVAAAAQSLTAAARILRRLKARPLLAELEALLPLPAKVRRAPGAAGHPAGSAPQRSGNQISPGPG